jgi:hypothetical protein
MTVAESSGLSILKMHNVEVFDADADFLTVYLSNNAPLDAVARLSEPRL